MTPDENHSVDRGRAAQGPSPRVPDPATVQLGLRFAVKRPIVPCAFEVGEHCGRHFQGKPGILRTGFDQQHPVGGVGGQAVGQDAAGRTGTNDDVVEFHLGFPWHGRQPPRPSQGRGESDAGGSIRAIVPQHLPMDNELADGWRNPALRLHGRRFSALQCHGTEPLPSFRPSCPSFGSVQPFMGLSCCLERATFPDH